MLVSSRQSFTVTGVLRTRTGLCHINTISLICSTTKPQIVHDLPKSRVVMKLCTQSSFFSSIAGLSASCIQHRLTSLVCQWMVLRRQDSGITDLLVLWLNTFWSLFRKNTSWSRMKDFSKRKCCIRMMMFENPCLLWHYCKLLPCPIKWILLLILYFRITASRIFCKLKIRINLTLIWYLCLHSPGLWSNIIYKITFTVSLWPPTFSTILTGSLFCQRPFTRILFFSIWNGTYNCFNILQSNALFIWKTWFEWLVQWERSDIFIFLLIIISRVHHNQRNVRMWQSCQNWAILFSALAS